MDVGSVRLITFDCYGTLIDWETGMLSAFRSLFWRNGKVVSDEKLLEVYGDAEAEIEAGPYQRYRTVLSETVQAMGRELGVDISAHDSRQFAASVPLWEPFPDTVACLQALARRYKLGIISNIDDDLFAGTQKKLGVRFDLIVTAEQVQSYKPSLRNFQEALRRSGLGKDEVLHAGQSVYHDIVPASFLGIANVWVNRPSIRPGAGAAKPASAQPQFEVQNLNELLALMTNRSGKATTSS
ncbi:MAG TPA: haloacid dehalogenase type II [Candidatus Angelobacter sp.]|nr:haloacid dehalogenase type II [Candidatus Angelobacter sp.]